MITAVKFFNLYPSSFFLCVYMYVMRIILKISKIYIFHLTFKALYMRQLKMKVF